MTCNRFIVFERGKIPSREDVGKALEDYLGEIALNVYRDGNRYVAVLVGNLSGPFQQIDSDPSLADHYLNDNEDRGRWFEVHLGEDDVNVMTRQSDCVTNAVARGFAKLVAQCWHGRLEMEN